MYIDVEIDIPDCHGKIVIREKKGARYVLYVMVSTADVIFDRIDLPYFILINGNRIKCGLKENDEVYVKFFKPVALFNLSGNPRFRGK